MPVEVTHRVNFYDTDAMAVVHHANYIRWFEIGRVAYLRRIGITLGALMEAGYVFPITKVGAEYHAPGHFDDELVIETTATALTKAKWLLRKCIYAPRYGTYNAPAQGVLCADGSGDDGGERRTGHWDLNFRGGCIC